MLGTLPPEVMTVGGVLVALFVGFVLWKLLKLALKAAAIVALALAAAFAYGAWRKGALDDAAALKELVPALPVLPVEGMLVPSPSPSGSAAQAGKEGVATPTPTKPPSTAAPTAPQTTKQTTKQTSKKTTSKKTTDGGTRGP